MRSFRFWDSKDSCTPHFLFVCILITALSTSLAAEDAGSEECNKILSQPPFSKIKELTENGRYSLLSTRTKDSPEGKLIGVKCSLSQIKNYMVDAGWVFKTEVKGHFKNSKGEWDSTLIFCRQKQRYWGAWRENYCSGSAQFRLRRGRVSRFYLGPTK